MNKDEIARQRELLAKATPGPWIADDCLILTEHENWLRQVVADTEDSVEMFNAKGEAHDASAANAELIVAAVNELPSLLDTAERVHALEELTGMSVTVGDGLRVYGTVKAISRVQQYILLDSKHPVEASDVRRLLALDLQAAEAKIAALEAENKRLREERKAIIAALAPYPFCRHPTKCTKGRCEAEFCCND